MGLCLYFNTGKVQIGRVVGVGGLEQLKFQQPIQPYDTVVLHLQRNDLKVQFKLMRADTPLASGRLYFEAATHV